MAKPATIASPSSHLLRYAWILAALWTIAVGASWLWSLHVGRQEALRSARAAARDSYNKDVVYRRWAAGHGGVYVPVSENTPPNPYLAHVPERDIETPSGRRLTLVNPAYMTRQVYELGREQYGLRGHITSLKPLRKENAPDTWEAEALTAFERGEQEVSSVALIDGEPFLRLMRPMITEQSCLGCHAEQGYRVGDIRGGISVSVPLAPYRQIAAGHMIPVTLGYCGLWILGVGGLGVAMRRIKIGARRYAIAASELHREKQRLEDVTGIANCGLLLLDEDCKVTFANRRAQDWFGPFDEIQGKRCSAVFALRDPENECVGIKALRTGETVYGESLTRTVDGKPRVFQVIASPARDDDGRIRQISEVIVDVTEFKRAEEKLQREAAMRGILLENLPCIALILKKGTREIVYSNKAGRELGAVPGTTCYATCAERDDPCPFCLAPDVWDTNNPRYLEVEYRGEYYEDRWIPLTDDLYVHYVFNISDRVKAEKEKEQLNDRLRHSQKMDAIGQLAGGVAHDFNNILTAVFGNAELLGELVSDQREAADYLQNITEAAQQAVGVTRGLLTFSRKSESQKELVDLSEVVERSVRMLRRVLSAGIDLVADVARDQKLTVYGDDAQLQQVVMNLAINARDAMPQGGVIRMTVSRGGTPDSPAELPGEVRLVVTDNGTGMTRDVCERLFEPFFTTKAAGRGTGLGLSIVHGIVQDHGGRIDVESEPGQGSTFTVILPARATGDAAKPAELNRPTPRGRGELVLIAEDDSQVRRIIKTALSALAYNVIDVPDGQALLDAFSEHQDQVGLIVTDIDMPRRGGLEVLREIRGSGTRTPCILITGVTDFVDEDQLDENTILLYKPFQLATLGRIAAQMCGSPEAAGSEG